MNWVLKRVAELHERYRPVDTRNIRFSTENTNAEKESEVKLYSNLTQTQKMDGFMKAIDESRVIAITYDRSYEQKDGSIIRKVTHRKVKASHLYVFADGTAYVRAFCTKVNGWRKFRMQNITQMGLGKVTKSPDGTFVFPGKWELRNAFATKAVNLQKWLDAGWSTNPVVLTEPA